MPSSPNLFFFVFFISLSYILKFSNIVFLLLICICCWWCISSCFASRFLLHCLWTHLSHCDGQVSFYLYFFCIVFFGDYYHPFIAIDIHDVFAVRGGIVELFHVVFFLGIFLTFSSVIHLQKVYVERFIFHYFSLEYAEG